MRWDFHPEALEEYELAAQYYSERDPELALRFIESIENAIERIIEAPIRWRVIDNDIRRCLAQSFPYGILYTVESDFVLIVAVCISVVSPVIGNNESRRPSLLSRC